MSLYDYGVKKRAHSFKKPIPPWPIGFGQTATFWWNLYTVMDEAAWFIFLDPRLSSPLTAVARKFVLSAMHERIRVADPDFSDAKLAVAQFGRGEGGSRVIRLHELKDPERFSIDQLNEMVEETYELWIEILAERARARPTGTTPLGF
jgi:hypothetical protein